MTKLADIDDKIVGITAAMPDGTGLNIFAEAHKDHFFDVGIAEQHAVTAAAGMAAAGMKPVAAIYSTFMQRAYDSIMHDICMQKLHVTLCLDRAGLVGDDGYTHHGVFDYAYLRSIPNMTIMAPKDENELQHMLKTALDFDGPVSVRYPRAAVWALRWIRSGRICRLVRQRCCVQARMSASGRLAAWCRLLLMQRSCWKRRESAQVL